MNRTLNKNITPTVINTQDVWDYLDSTNNQVNAVSNDYEYNTDVVPKLSVINWEKFWYEWYEFYEREYNTTHIFGAADIMDKIDVYVNRLKTHRDNVIVFLKKAGRNPTSTEVVVPVKTDPVNEIKILGIGMLLGAGSLILLRFLIK